MTDALEKAKDAVRAWANKHADSDPMRFKHGDRVVEMGGDGTLLYIAGFERDWHEDEYHARCLVLGSDKVVRLPVSCLKLSHEKTIH